MRVMPVTVLTGPRQTGKTTLARAIVPSATYQTLDDLGVLDQALEDPASLTLDPPVIIDEVQRAPRLVLAVKHAVDQDRRGSLSVDRLRQSPAFEVRGGFTGR